MTFKEIGGAKNAANAQRLKERFPEEFALMEDANLRMTMGVAGIINQYEEIIVKRDELLQARDEAIAQERRIRADLMETIKRLEMTKAELQKKLASKRKRRTP